MELASSFLFYILLLSLLIQNLTCEEITIFSAKDTISFAKIMDYKIKLSGNTDDEITKYTYSRSFVSVVVNVTLSQECLDNTNVSIFV